MILNAGVGGWKGWNWPVAIWGVLTNMPASVTWPTYKLGYVGRVTRSQLSSTRQETRSSDSASKSIAESTTQETEPALGETFTANVFGHYMLVHQLSPLLSSRSARPSDTAQHSRIIWVSSIEAYAHSFQLSDLQGLRDQTSYESSKRLTDLLVLTSTLPSTQRHVSSFLPPPQSDPSTAPPTQYLCHPGICATSIAGLPWLLKLSMIATFYIARLLQSPWHTISPYLGAVSVVWLALSPESYLLGLESEDADQSPASRQSAWSSAPGMNKSKWGSSTDISGNERVIRTEVEGWGWAGVVGQMPDGGMRINGGREPGAKMLGREDREGFEELGALAWGAMETLRTEWMERLRGVGE